MKTALIVVDFQTDFRADGTLQAERSEEALEPLLSLAAEVDYVVASRDWHPENHCSFSSEPDYETTWPIHCVQDTPGAEIASEVAAVADAIVTKGDEQDKDAYSAFDGHTGSNHSATLTDWLNEHEVDTVIVGGLVTEVCVKATALDAKKEGFRTVVNVQAAAALDDEGSKKVLNEMKQRGVHISYREPGESMARDAMLARAIETITMEVEEADRQGNRQLSDWLSKLPEWIDQYAQSHPEEFTIIFPNFTYDEVETITIPEAARSASGGS